MFVHNCCGHIPCKHHLLNPTLQSHSNYTNRLNNCNCTKDINCNNQLSKQLRPAYSDKSKGNNYPYILASTRPRSAPERNSQCEEEYLCLLGLPSRHTFCTCTYHTFAKLHFAVNNHCYFVMSRSSSAHRLTLAQHEHRSWINCKVKGKNVQVALAVIAFKPP